MISRSDIIGALMRGYADKLNRSKELDLDLIEAMADEVMAVISTALQREDFYRTISINKESRR